MQFAYHKTHIMLNILMLYLFSIDRCIFYFIAHILKIINKIYSWKSPTNCQ